MTNAAPAVPGAGPLAAYSEALASIVETVGRSALAVPGRHRHGLASAVVWRPGIVVTAAHVFRHPPAAVSLVGPDGKIIEATLAGIDTPTDVAVFRVAEEGAAPAQLGDPSTLKAGSVVIAVGRSAGGDPTASYGIVNRSSGPWETWLGGQLDRMIRLDGGIYEGLSGAPVADASGAIIGIASSALSRSYGMVVPAATVNRVVDSLLSKGHVARAFLGVSAQPVPLGLGQEGVGLLVTGLVPGGPAQAAGLMVGDILVSVDGKPAASLHELRQGLADRVGQPVVIRLQRGGVATELALTVGQWPTERRGC
ncbi:MAG TPA: S1C family serine protease [Methylibium sp.]